MSRTKKPEIKPGDKFGKWTVLGEPFNTITGWRNTESRVRKEWLIVCECKCGLVKAIRVSGIQSAQGCNSCCRQKHGFSTTKLNNVWRAIESRCNNPSHKSYKNYGGRGITLCESWSDFLTFRKWALANGYRKGLSIDRKNNNGNYEPDNCRWVDSSTQQRNTRQNHLLSVFGETKCLVEWTEDERCKVEYSTLWARIKRGMPPEQALTLAV